MKNVARLAESWVNETTNIKITDKDDFPGSTLHGHDFYEIDVIYRGESDSTVNGRGRRVKSGDVFLLTPSDFHEYTSADEMGVYNIQFTEDSISSELQRAMIENKEKIITPSGETFRNIVGIISAMLNLQDSHSGDGVLSRLLECVLIILLSENGERPREQGDYPRDMQKAVVYIHAHFRENPTLSAVARTLPLNERYFCARFKEYTGKSYKDYLRSLKLRYARRLVMATSLSMIEISASSGYSSQTHFNKEFKEYYGITPMKMRQNAK